MEKEEDEPIITNFTNNVSNDNIKQKANNPSQFIEDLNNLLKKLDIS